MPSVEPYKDPSFPERFLRWIEHLRGVIASVPDFVEGDGSPEGVVTARRGTRYFDRDGSGTSWLYVKTTRTGNTGWVRYAVEIPHTADTYLRRNADNDAWEARTPQQVANEIAPLASVWLSKAIGETVYLRDDLSGVDVPPTDDENFRFIKLTAGETGSGQYNEGVLTSESVSGSAPLVVATAVISMASSPMDGQTVNLLNTENRYLMPGTSPGTAANDQMQQITGSATNGGVWHEGSGSGTGALSAIPTGRDNRPAPGDQNGQSSIDLNSANSPNARTGDHTNVKHQQVTAYMRIA